MPSPWCPYATRDPGVSAGYAHGKVANVVSVVAHYTVGVDSRALIRDQGLAEFLVSRGGTVWQFAEVDAVCWQAGDPYNHRGPGIEVEWYEPHDGPAIFTDVQRDATQALCHWLHEEWGVPLDYKADAPRVADWVGWIAHRAVIEDADYHSDYWPQADWDAMTAAPPAPVPTEDDMPIIIRDNTNRTLLVTDEEVYEVSGLTTPNVVATKEQADFIIADVRAKYQARTT